MKQLIHKLLREGLIKEANQPSIQRVVDLLNALEFKGDVLSAGGNIYAVGGIVRDALMGKASDDLDIVVRGIPYDKLFRILSRYGTPTDTSVNKVKGVMVKTNVSTGEKDLVISDDTGDFGATKFVSNNPRFNDLLDKNGIVKDIDVMLPRKDAKDPNVKGHKGIKSDVNHEYTIEDDLERRDITINAIALGLDGKIIDKGGKGQADIKSGTIRAVSEDAFLEDPLRMLRAVRFSGRFDYKMDPKTLNLIKKNVKLLSDKEELPKERFLMEFEKMIGKVDLGKAVKLLVDLGMYEAIFGVKSKIKDFSKFDKAKSLGEFAYMLFEGHAPNVIISKAKKDEYGGLVVDNITNNVDTLRYVNALVMYLNQMKGKNFDMVKEIDGLAKLYNMSPTMLLQSNYIDSKHRDIANKFKSGELPKGDKDISFKGDEFLAFAKDAIIDKYGQFVKADGRRLGMAKNVALQAVYGGKVANEPEAIKQFLIANSNAWLT
jgi:tRNA nucleotidyltransferase/poly(A) polymerase